MSTTSSTSQAGDLPKPFPPTAPDSSQPSPPPSTLQYAKTYVYPIYVTLDPMQPLHIQTDQVIRKFHQGKLPLEFELVTFSKHKRRKKEVHSSDSNGEEVFSSTSNSSDLADDEEEDADEEDENDADEEEDEEDVEEEEDEEEEEVGEEEENGDEDDEDEEATEEEEGDVREGTKELDRVFCDPSNSFLDGLLKKYPPHSSSSSNQGAETEEASSPSNSSKKRKGLRRRYKEEWYDSDDSFIDDSGEFRDNVGLMRTVRTGFFLQEGPIDVVPLAGVNKVTESLSKPKPTLTISTISTPSSENEEIQQEIQNFKLLANPLDWSQKSVFPSVLKEPLYKLVERFFLLHQTVPSTSFLIAVTRTMPYNLYTIKRYIARHCIGRYQQQELLPRIETLFSKLKENSVETWNAENFSSVSQDRESEEGVIKKRRVHLTGDLKRLLNEILQIEKFSFELTSWKEKLLDDKKEILTNYSTLRRRLFDKCAPYFPPGYLKRRDIASLLPDPSQIKTDPISTPKSPKTSPVKPTTVVPPVLPPDIYVHPHSLASTLNSRVYISPNSSNFTSSEVQGTKLSQIFKEDLEYFELSLLHYSDLSDISDYSYSDP